MPRFLSSFAVCAVLACGSQLAAETSIAVVDFERVLSTSAATAPTRDAIIDRNQELRAQLQEVTAQMQELQAELEVLNQSAPSYADTATRYQLLERRRELLQDQRKQEVSRLTFQHFAAGHQLISQQLAEFAAERGISLVLRKPYPMQEANSADEFQLKLQFDTVLYSAPQLDLTTDFITYVDAAGETTASITETAGDDGAQQDDVDSGAESEGEAPAEAE